MKKREFLGWTGACLWGLPSWASAAIPVAVQAPVLAGAGVVLTPGGEQGFWVGTLQPRWEERRMSVLSRVTVPTRAHEMVALPDGGYVAVALRPGRWLLRCDASGAVQQRLDMQNSVRTLDGHAAASFDGQWLYTTETDPRTGQGWVAVRDVRTLQQVSEFRTWGSEPHEVLLDDSGALVVANGGLLRDAKDRKVDVARMDSSLVRLRPESGERLGQWRLSDKRLGLRHMAWSTPVPGAPAVLGIVMQNEHEDAQERKRSPVLALWDGKDLTLPTSTGLGDGYAGDIAPTPDGGFLISSQRAGAVLRWSPQRPEQTEVVAQLKEVGALVRVDGSDSAQARVLIAAQTSAAYWSEPSMGRLDWPQDVAQMDNHWAVLRAV